MITNADKLRITAKRSAPNYARSILFPTSLQDRIADVCDTRASQGLTNYIYTFVIDQGFPENVIFKQLREFIKPFEENDYRIAIMKKKAGEETEFKVIFFWSEPRPNDISESLGCDEILYTTSEKRRSRKTNN